MTLATNKKEISILLAIILISSIAGLGLGYFIQSQFILKNKNITSFDKPLPQKSYQTIDSTIDSNNGLDLSSQIAVTDKNIITKVSSITSSSAVSNDKIIDKDGRKYTYLLQKSGINGGFIWSTDIRDLRQNQPFSNDINLELEKKLPTQPQPLQEVVPAPKECSSDPNEHIKQGKNWLSFEKYDVQAPILMASFQDFYIPDPKTNYISLDKPIEESQLEISRGNYLSVPVQKLLTQGVVHLPVSPMPGQVGNSYIVGHTSNFNSIKSDYNRIFKSFEQRSQKGDEFTIWDHLCRKLKFKVFDVASILAEDTDTAYKSFGDKRVVTLQGSILELVNGTLQPTRRWLTRGELVLDTSKTVQNSSQISDQISSGAKL